MVSDIFLIGEESILVFGKVFKHFLDVSNYIKSIIDFID